MDFQTVRRPPQASAFVILFFAAGFFFFACTAFMAAHIPKTYIRTQGTVQKELEVRRETAKGVEISYYPQFTFQDESSATLTATSNIYVIGRRYHTGQVLDIAYDRRDPVHTAHPVKDALAMIAIGVGLTIISIILTILAFNRYKQKR